MIHSRTAYYRLSAACAEAPFRQLLGVTFNFYSTNVGHIKMGGPATKVGHLDRTSTEPREKVS